ncbi:UDP-N-acetylglucosamine--N-acetylmuramyl-(pentapeptide) pyrophosphoryl-undecaprenol N-acetylglucosamine transferase [Schaalia sp. 19OD2882]|uniref:UDP-N-acetylglucosamine--N-acetylmuramyl- (pentapeptide) pyrophosphoryl-undecaprenol N-acetylglucosamine transferase n=1 Tax=Schaalia sp. 19OD2882 TaxID=2794089 RepID=UPI001C1EEAE4|nr:UDP-N-acetylglucosamine--N-acetylmuramyl-(pentapeptide) pyrophosphoryl-undecaprenol N-acetylglucosamine transferase [Schaalia sp. 19OD2882]QWW18941.1 UDP-N-acetylglucosamine--N-acetylmuramyl-(pentapeptide) pyrophosphoryl-undecaprenol N-acetylglucosamine transferase [Schaalia sp. 19OD2882]
MRIVLAGGGTAGHVNPLLATADVLRSRGARITVLGTAEGLEADLVPAAGFDMETIAKVPLPRRPSPALLTLPVRLQRTVEHCRRVLEGADALVGFGGYVSTPAYLAARGAKVPVVVHEQNASPGLANKVGASFADVVALTFDSTPLRCRKGRTVTTGLPLRAAIAHLAADRRDPQRSCSRRAGAAKRLGIDPQARTLLVTGGSLGALHVNEAVTGAAADLPEGVQVVHLTGKGKDGAVREAVEAAGVAERWLVLDYLSTMEDALAVADLAVCRSGAGTVAEMTALGVPCVYVPLAIGNGEQKLNAADHVASGGAILVDDARFTAQVVRERVMPMLVSDDLEEMARASADLGHVDAATELADIVEEVAKEGHR